MRNSESVPISSTCEVNPSFNKSSFEDNQLVSFIPMKAVEEETGILDISESITIGEIRKKSYRGFQEGDVLFAKITPCMENGKSAIAKDLANGLGVGSTEFHILRSNESIHPKYLLRFVLRKEFRSKARRIMTGASGHLRVPSSFFDEAIIPLPSLPEQERIVSILDEASDSVQGLMDGLLTKLSDLEDLKQSVLEKAFAGELTDSVLEEAGV